MEFAASMAAAAAGGNKLICKITSWDEFWTSLDKYVFLATGGKTEQKETKASEETLNDDKDTNLEPESTKDNDSNVKFWNLWNNQTFTILYLLKTFVWLILELIFKA